MKKIVKSSNIISYKKQQEEWIKLLAGRNTNKVKEEPLGIDALISTLMFKEVFFKSIYLELITLKKEKKRKICAIQNRELGGFMNLGYTYTQLAIIRKLLDRDERTNSLYNIWQSMKPFKYEISKDYKKEYKGKRNFRIAWKRTTTLLEHSRNTYNKILEVVNTSTLHNQYNFTLSFKDIKKCIGYIIEIHGLISRFTVTFPISPFFNSILFPDKTFEELSKPFFLLYSEVRIKNTWEEIDRQFGRIFFKTESMSKVN